jgi:hypothetical protein
MKAQMQIVSIILIIGIIVVLTGATYFWGKPLIDKRVIITQLASLKGFMNRLNEKTVDMARSCTGFCDESLTILPGSHVKAYGYNDSGPDNNSIILKFAVDYLVMGNESVPLNTNILEMVAPYGEANGILTMKQTLEGQQYIITFKLQYRELDTIGLPKEGYKIILEPGAMAGQQEITISFGGASIIPGGAANGGPLTTMKIKIETI